jgi:mono/diheme cytochrome c family protein
MTHFSSAERTFFVRFALLSALSGYLLFSPADWLAADPSEQEHALSADALEAATTAFAARCAKCHGADGRGTSARQNLVDKLWHHGSSPAEIARTIRDGVPDTEMPGHEEDFSEQRIAELARFVQHLASRKHAEVAAPNRQAATELTDRSQRALPFSTPARDFDSVAGAAIIDRHIFEKMAADDVPHAGLCSDAEFLRRLYLDVWGRLPGENEVRKFLEDDSAEKRNRLIDKLLGLDFLQKPGHDDYKGPWLVEKPFLNKWTYFFGDLFRNGPQGNGDRFKEYIATWLRFNIPYDYVVRDMLTATAITAQSSGVAGFLTRHEVDGLRCADVMHEDTCDEIALHTTRVFLGISMECVSCHDGAGHVDGINLWLTDRKRVEFWRQAAFFGNLRIFRASLAGQEFTLLDGPPLRPENIWQGKIAGYESKAPLTPYGGLGYRLGAPSVLRVPRDPKADVFPEFLLTKEQPARGANPRHEYARMITMHPQFAKATVNLIWSRFMTTGIVEPVFGWDMARQDASNPPPAPWKIQPSHPDLIEELADWFRKSGHDLRLLMRTIVRSKAYQLSSRFEGDYPSEHDRYYARKLVRRLSAEEIYDALAMATNVYGHGIKFSLEQTGPPPDAELRQFLDFFGQGNRITKLPETTVSSIQAALMMNSDLVKRKVSAKTEGSLVHSLVNSDPPLPNDQIVQRLYLATLCRYPSEVEKTEAVAHILQHGEQGIEDIQWALVNKLEFIINY